MKTEIALALHEIGAVKFGEFTLKTGIKSPIYIDLRVLISYPKILKMIASAMIGLTDGLKFDVVGGVPYTALPIATAMSLEKGWPMVYARKEAKDYGTKKMVEGVYPEGAVALIIEDLITSGTSILENVEKFNASGLQVKDCIVLIDREQSGKKNLEERGLNVRSVLGINELLNILHEVGKLDDTLYKTAKDFIAQTQTKI